MKGREKRNHSSQASEGGRNAGLGCTGRSLKQVGELGGRHGLGSLLSSTSTMQCSAGKAPWFCFFF